MNAIDKIHDFVKFGSVLGLERMNSLLELLGNPQDDLKVIHVAGTNGKGSTCKYLYNVLEAAGYRTGLYTSPFLEVFNERIELHGEYISDEDLETYTERVMQAVKVMTERGEASPTEFEVITAIAFLYFKEKEADIVVLEVGLGGKGDSTNVVKEPLASVIASISFDHTDRLGNTLAEIAAEKAGIIKDRCPVITSCRPEEALAVIENTAEEHSAMYFETRNIPYTVVEKKLTGCVFDTDIQGVEFKGIEIGMLGEHQIENAILALATINILEENGDIKVSRAALLEGFKKAKQIGRFEIMSEKDADTLVIIDGAHNPDGALSLKNTVKAYLAEKKILMVTGMLADKDTDSIIGEFTEIAKDFIITEPQNPRKMAAAELAEKFKAKGVNAEAEPDYVKAKELAFSKAGEYDVILFAGSLYLIGAVRALLH